MHAVEFDIGIAQTTIKMPKQLGRSDYESANPVRDTLKQ